MHSLRVGSDVACLCVIVLMPNVNLRLLRNEARKSTAQFYALFCSACIGNVENYAALWQVTNSKEQSPSSITDIRSANQNSVRHFSNPKILYRVRKSPPLESTGAR
jgi:hypothetical protein